MDDTQRAAARLRSLAEAERCHDGPIPAQIRHAVYFPMNDPMPVWRRNAWAAVARLRLLRMLMARTDPELATPARAEYPRALDWCRHCLERRQIGRKSNGGPARDS